MGLTAVQLRVLGEIIRSESLGVMPVNKLLLTMAAPMVLSMLIGALYNVVDSLFVSHYGENAFSA